MYLNKKIFYKSTHSLDLSKTVLWEYEAGLFSNLWKLPRAPKIISENRLV